MKKSLFIAIALLAAAPAAKTQTPVSTATTTTTVVTDASQASLGTGTTSVRKPDPYLVPVRGYHGFVSADVNFLGAYGSDEYGFSTSHGLMLTSRHYLGLSAGYMYCPHFKKGYVPVGVDGRIYFPSSSRRIYPHIGARLGVTVPSAGSVGFYAQVSGGVRVPVARNCGLNLEVGPQLLPKYEKLEAVLQSPKYENKGSRFGIFVRVGFDF